MKPKKQKRAFRLKKLIVAFLLFVVLFILSGGAFFALVYQWVVAESSSRIQRGAIDSVIFSESPVYYDDGESILGVFFDKTHRKYINYKDIPPIFIQALLAAEDSNFFHHPGFDLKAVFRALIVNLKSGRVVQGGSTITQQTAKNIFTREKRSLQAKIKELVQALLLEKEYSKEEILEMYINQFFVTGFGRGLRIAAQYFFDKEAESLDLVESAFIAGSVKSPNKYNPFTKKTEKEKREARRLSKLRKDYVLQNMAKLQFITDEQYRDAAEREVPFKEGRVTYRLNVVLDYIRDQLDSDYFKAILHEQGIDNVATSGIRIYTSINKTIQEGALKSIRTHLPLLDVKLSGWRGSLFQEKYKELAEETQRRLDQGLPFVCRITQINLDKEGPSLAVSWNGGEGLVDYEGIQPIGDAWLKGEQGAWAVFEKRYVAAFLKQFQVGQLVPAQIIGQDSSGRHRLMISQIPELEGGIVVLRDGMIKAMVGGFFDRFFNRAVDAKRQFGSIFKPMVYTAALQLKWSLLDPLANMTDLYRFSTTLYVPRPDHQPSSSKVSMVWAGAKSENLATVWLLYHLTDHLSAAEFHELVETVGLGKKKDESYEEYARRIRDEHGLTIETESLMETAFEEAKKAIESDLIFSGQEETLDSIHRLHYEVETGDLDLSPEDRANILRLSFQRLRAMNRDLKRKINRAEELSVTYAATRDQALERAVVSELLGLYYVGQGEANARVSYYGGGTAEGGAHPVAQKWFSVPSGRIRSEDVWIDNMVPSRCIDLLEHHMDRIYEGFQPLKRYDEELLYRVRDFKTLVNLYYVTRLSREMGFFTKLDPVLSFPLGANSVSILEAGLAYHTIMTGKVYPQGGRMSMNMVPVITKINDNQGNLIWEYQPHPKDVLSPRVSAQVTHILHNVMQRGTGHVARDSVRLSLDLGEQKVDITIPPFGKTGTANRFTNSSFVGFVPGPQKDSGHLTIKDGYVISAYVGYDDNRPMKGKRIVIYGSSGALPLWVDTANAVVNSKDYRQRLQLADLAFDVESLPSRLGLPLESVRVSSESGLPVKPDGGGALAHHPQVLFQGEADQNGWNPTRVFEPSKGD